MVGVGFAAQGFDGGTYYRLQPGALDPRVDFIMQGVEDSEVVGDYGAGPNHTLPTGGGARFAGGLSVLDFLRVRTWLRIDDEVQASGLLDDAAALADLEGLRGHRQAALLRCRSPSVDRS